MHRTTARTIATVLFPVAVATLSAFGQAQDVRNASSRKMDSTDLVETAAKAGKFNTLLAAAKAAGLVDTLKSKGPLTVFAPTDAAFDKLPDGTVEKLLKNKKKLAQILTYHVVAGNVPAKKLIKNSWAKTVEGQSFRVMVVKDEVFVDNAKVIKTDIAASNGMIHVIDSVIMPRPDIVDTAVSAGSFKTLVTAVKAADLVDTLKGKGPFTVFAPTDDAFAALPDGTVASLLKDVPKLESILLFHVVSGRVLAEDLPMSTDGSVSARPKTVQGQKLEITRSKDGKVLVNGARVIKSDVIAGNGVIHVIDKVILPQ